MALFATAMCEIDAFYFEAGAEFDVATIGGDFVTAGDEATVGD